MRALNLLAYRGRYQREAAQEEAEDIFPREKLAPESNFEGRPSSKPYLSLLMMLDCFSYQCAEDPAIDTADYKSLENIIAQMKSRVVNDLEAYNSAGWGMVPDIFTKTA